MRSKLALVLLLGQAMLFSGCTSVLWEKETFAHHYTPAKPSNLALFYSPEKKDVLVQYDECCDFNQPIRHRAYFAGRNERRVNNRHKPRFVSSGHRETLVSIPITSTQPRFASTSPEMLCAVYSRDDDSFSLYSNGKLLDSYMLPVYVGNSRRVKQVLLTPGAVMVDCTIVGAVAAYYWGPYALSALQGKSL